MVGRLYLELIGLVAQLVSALACHARGREFKSRLGRVMENEMKLNGSSNTFTYYQQPQYIVVKTIKTVEYDEQGRVVKETTEEHRQYNNTYVTY